ncbi:carbohydrate ABC transporter permease [Nocardioides sp. B-3]|uniref:carbohydrate ABC transporter permease n=1 Tax=Nocardioides sp. B-3 TaxID=2895565 RepID=UPI0021532ADD|nr:carbohydrate ABC transporter permease [Nocardioides sp. B-3]UUZ58625.1 carbohydrate ABC transporter permease [Nocardioides sp. B-3]
MASPRGRLVTVVLAACSPAMVSPFVWELLTTMKSPGEATRVPPVFIPSEWRVDNFARLQRRAVRRAVLQHRHRHRPARDRTAAVLLAGGLCLRPTALPGSNLVFLLCLSILMVPAQLYVIPQYQIMVQLDWLNTLRALTVPGLFSAFGVFLLRQFFMALPRDPEDAARIDGCNPLQTYWYVMLPPVRPGLVALGVLTTIWSWNELLWPPVVNTDPEKMTLSAGLASLQGQRLTDFPVLMAGAVMASLPMIVLFAVMQRQFIASIATTGVKG